MTSIVHVIIVRNNVKIFLIKGRRDISSTMGLFGKTKAPDPKEQVQEWSRKIRKEGHQLDRQVRVQINEEMGAKCHVGFFHYVQINQIKREELKATRSIKECAKRGDKESARVLAKEVVASRKAVNRIYTAKANLSSVEMQMRNQASQLRLAGSLQKSSEVMKSMQQLVKLPELQKTMMELSKEMTKVRHTYVLIATVNKYLDYDPLQ